MAIFQFANCLITNGYHVADPAAEAMVQALPWAIPLRLEPSKLPLGAMAARWLCLK